MSWNPHLSDHFGQPCYQRTFVPLKPMESGPKAGMKLKKAGSPGTTTPAKSADFIFSCFIFSCLSLLVAVLVTSGYSGEGTPPMYGDYEAQRHWMEITYHLPISQWYINSTDNNLQYWGLDYPPLTAYHSWLMGALAHRINPSWVALHSSRGIENREHKFFMRLSAIVPLILLYFPVIVYLALNPSQKKSDSRFLLVLCTLYSGLLTMDGAHFQYNSISLGLFVCAVLCLTEDRTLLGSILFVLAVNYKQMELYHSLPIFVFILARCIRKPILSRFLETFANVFKVGITVLIVFGLLWAPFIYEGVDHLQTVIGRIFPFYRGLYEDKVASFWCAFSFALKLNRWFSQAAQIRISTIVVLLCSFPSLAVLFHRPTSRNFRFSLFLTSLSFFLFSFQVHEKSILVPAAAAFLLASEFPLEIFWFLSISNYSLFSLCIKDRNPMFLFLFWSYDVMCQYFLPSTTQNTGKVMTWSNLKVVSSLGASIICLLEWHITPPNNLPHIFPLLNAVYSCCHFLCFLAYFYYVFLREELQKTRQGQCQKKQQ